jgi:hypothetical protein
MLKLKSVLWSQLVAENVHPVNLSALHCTFVGTQLVAGSHKTLQIQSFSSQ